MPLDIGRGGAGRPLVGSLDKQSPLQRDHRAAPAPVKRRARGPSSDWGSGSHNQVEGKLGFGFGRLFHAEKTPVTLWLWQPDPQSLDAPHPAEEHEADRLERTLR